VTQAWDFVNDAILWQTRNSAVLAAPIEEFEFTVRTMGTLRAEGIKTIADLIEKTDSELIRCPNFGMVSLSEIKRFLAARGLTLKSPENVKRMEAKRPWQTY